MTTQTPQGEDLLTVTETAALLGVHPRTIWRYLRNDRLPAVRHPLSRRVHVPRAAVVAAREDAYRRLRAPRPENTG